MVCPCAWCGVGAGSTRRSRANSCLSVDAGRSLADNSLTGTIPSCELFDFLRLENLFVAAVFLFWLQRVFRDFGSVLVDCGRFLLGSLGPPAASVAVQRSIFQLPHGHDSR